MNDLDFSIAKSKKTIQGTAGDDSIFGSKYDDIIYSNGGSDIITGNKGNDKIYLDTNSENTELYFNKGDGKDTIYNSGGNVSIIYDIDSKDYDEGRVSLSFSKNKDNLIIKRSDSKDTITIDGYFKSKSSPSLYTIKTYGQYHCGSYIYSGHYKSHSMNSFNINITGSKNIQGSFLNDYIKGSKKADKIYSNGGDDVIYGDKGNDTIFSSGDNDDTYILINKKDGNDTVNVMDKNDYIHICFGKSANLSYSKNGSDVIITAIYDKTGKEKSPTKQTITIKNYFYEKEYIGSTSYGDIKYKRVYVDILNTDDLSVFKKTNEIYWKTLNSSNLSNLIDSEGIVQKAKVKKYNELTGTNLNDIFYGGNKTDVMIGINGQDKYYTGKKGSTLVSSGNENDQFYISSIKNKTFINDSGSIDSMQINDANADDLYLYFDYDINSDDFMVITNNEGNNITRDALYLMNGSELSSNIKNNAMAKELSVSKDKYSLAASGICINRFFGSGNIENISIADSKGNNIKTVTTAINSRIEDAITTTIDNIKSYLYEFSDKTNTQDFLNDIIATINNKKASKAVKTAAKKQLNDFINVYKLVKLGTDGNDTFSNLQGVEIAGGKKGQTIYSGKGSDTFKFGKYFGYNNSIVSESSNGTNIIPTDTNKLIFSSYSFEDGTLGISHNEIGDYTFGITAYNSKTGVTEGSVAYYGFLSDNPLHIPDKNIIIQDKNRAYNVTLATDGFSKDFSNSTNNNIIFCDNNESDIYIKTSKGYNIIDAGYSSKGNNTIAYSGGYDTYYMHNKTNDTYYIDFDKNTSVTILDYGNGTGEYDRDTLYVTGNISDMRLYFDVGNIYDSNGHVSSSYFGYGLKIMDKDNFNFANLKYDAKASGINIQNYFTNTSTGVGNMETINIVNETTPANIDVDEMQSWVKFIRGEVSAWLYNKGYENTLEVMQSNNKSDINALIGIYKNWSFNNYEYYTD